MQMMGRCKLLLGNELPRDFGGKGLTGGRDQRSGIRG